MRKLVSKAVFRKLPKAAKRAISKAAKGGKRASKRRKRY
jgi:hypothetical protein